MIKKVLALLLCIISLSSLVACGSDNEVDDTAKDTNSSAVDNSGDDTEQSSELTFWYNQQDWKNIPEGDYDGVLFLSKLTTPIDISKLDETSKPYHWFPNGVEGRNAESISDIIYSDALVYGGEDGKPSSISTQTTFDEQWMYHNTENPDGIHSIKICNFTQAENDPDSELPVKTCYENNWWYIEFPIESLGVSTEVYDDDYQIEIAEAVLKRFGAPDYFVTYSDFDENVKNNELLILYDLIYEFDEYIIEIPFSETIFSEYDTHNFLVDEVGRYARYYTKECWEELKPTKTIKNIE